MSKEFPITISSWTLGDQCKFEDRVIAAKNAGYEGIGLRAETYVDALNEGLFDKDILAVLDKHGMKVTEVEYIVQWAEEHRSYITVFVPLAWTLDVASLTTISAPRALEKTTLKLRFILLLQE